MMIVFLATVYLLAIYSLLAIAQRTYKIPNESSRNVEQVR